MRVWAEQQVPDLMRHGMAEESAVGQTADPCSSPSRVEEYSNIGATLGRHGGVPELPVLRRQLGVEDSNDEIGWPERSGAGWDAGSHSAAEALDELDCHTGGAEDPLRVGLQILPPFGQEVNVVQQANGDGDPAQGSLGEAGEREHHQSQNQRSIACD